MKKSFILLAIISILFLSCENSLFTNVAKIYKVKFSTNGGTPIEDVYTNEITELPYSEKVDCDLQGWFLTSDFSGTVLTFPFKITEQTTLYAKWIQKYNVIFNTNGGSEIPAQLTSKIETAPLAFKDDYELEGWYENADFSGGKIEFPYIVTKDIILHAKWNRVFNATFVVNGGTQVGNCKVSTISEVPVTTRDGFSFAGWYTTSDFSGKPVEFPFELTADTTFYAKWAEKFAVTFETNGGSAVVGMETGYIVEEPETKKTGMSFGGWYLDVGFTQKVEFPYEVTSNITLYAKWDPIRYKVTYEANGATSGTVPESESIENGSEYTVKGNIGNLVKGADSFTKWNTKADGTGTNYSAGSKMTISGDVTLYAQWGKDYARMIDVDGGTFTMGSSTSGNNLKHQVTVSNFRIAAYELTYEIWSEVYSWAMENGYNLTNAGKGVTDNDKYTDFEPATGISWNMAVVWLNAYSEIKGLEPVYYYNSNVLRDYLALKSNTAITFDSTKNGYRLPTEAEWEFAAGGGNYEYRDSLTYATSGTATKLDDIAWYYSNSGKETHPVGTKQPNFLGIYDMSGNVSEWCWDYYENYSSDAQTNPRGPSRGDYRVFRGGDYKISYDYYLSIRYRDYGNQSYCCGLRIAQNAQ